MELRLNDVLAPGISSEVIDRPFRVLAIDRELDQLWWIGFPISKKKRKRRTYIPGPACVPLSSITAALTKGRIQLGEIQVPAHYHMPDDYYVATAKNANERKRRKVRQRQRDDRWNIIAPLVEGTTPHHLAKWAGTVGPRITERAKACAVASTTVYRLLHCFLAGGSVLNALLPKTDLCGAPGKERAQKHRLGRRPKSVERDGNTEPGYRLTEIDKERLARGYSLISDKVGASAAFLMISGTFWGTLVVRPDGVTKTELWAPHLRPTLAQFRYWGEKRNTKKLKRKRVGADRWSKRDTHHGGSTQSQVGAFGQMAMFDSTSTDLYLTSMWDRTEKLSPATRTILMELRSTAIVGFFCGFEKPSSSVALQTILRGAESPEAKVALCKRYGVASTAADWIGTLCRLILADNGELKSSTATEAEKQFRFGIEYAKSFSGESKGDVESLHHVFHKKLDHTVDGASPGMRRRERGEDHAAIDAVWNHSEYMHHLLQEIIDYNRAEVPKLAPTQMLKEGIRPTRVNIARWLMEHGQRADIPYVIEQLRAFTLPDHEATIERNGIFLKANDGRRIPTFRYFANELRVLPEYRAAASEHRAIAIRVKCDGEDLKQIWLPTSAGLLRIPNQDADTDLVNEATMEDMVAYLDKEVAYRDETRQEREQAEFDKVLSRQATSARARTEIRQQRTKTGARPAKSKVAKNLRKSTTEEIERMASTKKAGLAIPNEPIPHLPSAYSEAANSAMDEFLKSHA